MITFKVKDVSKYISKILKNDVLLNDIKVEGEVSNFKKSGGHIYFSIKDDEAMLKCVIFRYSSFPKPINLSDGQKVIVKGSVTTYEKGSYYQIICKDVEEVGVGNLFEKYLELKEKLSKEGLFDEIHKKDIPKFPKNIGVVTALTGAAIRDIINTLRRRYKLANIYLYPAKVQGLGASDEIKNAMEYLDNLGMDTIIIGRGGGSFEDLNAFNDEELVRAVFNAKTPIISAVGHEVDTMLTDFVADKRAATPTAGAEISAVSLIEVVESLYLIEDRLNNKINDIISGEKIQLEHLGKELNYYNPKDKINSIKENLSNLELSLNQNILNIFEKNKKVLEFNKKALEMINPESVLKRGYSIIYKDDGIVNSIKNIKENEMLKIKLSDGEVLTEVKEILDVN